MEIRDGILGHQFNKRLKSFAPIYLRILKKTILLSGFKNSYKKICETRKLESVHEQHFVEQKNEGRKPDKNLSLKSLEFMSRNLE
jgi:hypothetical protein